MIARRRIFESVFPSPADKSQPTPQATPLIGAGSFTTSFGGLPSQDEDQHPVQQERAWHRLTEYLSIPNESITASESQHGLSAFSTNRITKPSQAVIQAIQYLCSPTTEARTSFARRLYSWYVQEVSRHYLRYELPLAQVCLRGKNPLSDVLELLQNVIQAYLSRWSSLRDGPGSEGDILLDSQELQQFLCALISASLAESSLTQLITSKLFKLAVVYFDLEEESGGDVEDNGMRIDGITSKLHAQEQLLRLLENVEAAGLGGAAAEKAFAGAMNDVVEAYVTKNYEFTWISPSKIPAELDEWVETSLAPFIAVALNTSRKDKSRSFQATTSFEEQDIADWKIRATYELGFLRMKQLFEIVVNWSDSRGAIEDLKYCLGYGNTRTNITTQFIEELSRRLLQPGASTSQILDLYIRLIQAFAVLDPRGVLLDRIARPIRSYLRDREDTTKLIVSGLLSDPYNEDNPDPLAILAIKLHEATQIAGTEDDGDLDWDDLEWVPNPIDAEPEYKTSKHSDVIGHLISLFESRDVFVKELQNILGERLLHVNDDYEAETRLLELLKIRFGEGLLQACEVMLKDISDSARIDAWVKREQNTEQTSKISAKVLSRLFWPALHTESFKLPPEISSLQEAYAAGFEKYKTTRKLAWLDVLGDVTVELELEDRTIEEVVKTPQAAVIYAFTDTNNATISKTIEQLVEELEMDEDLVENCLLFWVGKLVLVKSNSSYSVLERLPHAALQEASIGEASKSSTLAAAAVASATAASAPVSALRSEGDLAEEKMQVYWQFIVGMLTNQGAMPLARIVMMLKLAMAGGFPYSNEELRIFLDKRADAGKLELTGGNYKLIKAAI